MRACSGVWVAHGSGSADRETVGSRETACAFRRARSPTCSGASGSRPRRRRATTTASRTKGSGRSATSRTPGRSSAARTGSTTGRSTRSSPTPSAREVDSEDPIVLVQDYHFALAPRLIRERLPRATVIMFWHIPWPNSERFGICPWRNEIARRHARREHPRLPHAAPLQQLPRLRGPASSKRASTASRTRSCSTGAARSSAPIRSRSSGRSAGSRRRRRSPSAARACSRELGLPPDALPRRRRRPARLHQGHRGAAARRRAPARATSGVPRALHLRPARRAQPDRDRAVPGAEREGRGGGRPHQRALRPGLRTGLSSCCGPTTSRRPCSATTGRPISATSAACTTA